MFSKVTLDSGINKDSFLVYDVKQMLKKVEQDLEKLKKMSVELSKEIGKTLIGESIYTAEELSASIKDTKQAIKDKEKEYNDLNNKLTHQQEEMGKLDFYYEEFRSWAEEFDQSSNERRKMIICRLVKQIRLYKGYQYEIDFDSGYKRFLDEFTLAS